MQPRPLALALLAALPALAHGENATTLKPITLTSEQGASENNYTLPANSTATGLDLSLRQTPQSVSIVTARQLDDQQANTLGQALDQTPGIYHRTWGNTNSGYNIYLSRGYTLDNYRIDGASRQGMNGTQAFNNSDSAIYESLSLVRGATGLASGTGEPGGVLELTRKRPTREARTSIEAGGGNWSHIRTVLDSSGALNRDGSLRGRGIAVYDHGGDWQRRAKQDRGTLYGILEYDFTPDTTLTLGLQHNQMRARGSSMHSFETYYGNGESGYRPTPFGPRDNAGTRWSYNKSRSSEIFTRVNHRLNENWQLDAQYSYSFGKREQEYGVVGSVAVQHDGTARLTSGYWEHAPKEHNLDLNISGKYPLWGREHELKIGASYNHYDDSHNPLYARNVTPGGNIFTFQGDIARVAYPYKGIGGEKSHSASLYASTNLHLTDRWSILAGTRLTHWQANKRDHYNNFKTETQKENAILTPYLGTSYDLSDWLSAYASYSTIYKPQDKEDQNHRRLDPEQGSTYEIGLKGEWLDGKLGANLALYQGRKKNVAVKAGKHPDDTDYYRAADRVKNHGWEIGIGGEIKDGWLIHANYSHNRAKDRSGKRINTDIPADQIKLTTSYTPDKYWQIGASLNWDSKTWDTPRINDPVIRAAHTNKSHTTVDLMARYRVNDNLQFGINANNIFNSKYRVSLGYHNYGAPRHIMATLRYEF